MQRLDLKQLLGQKLSPQQIQFIKLLQIPTAELEMRVKEELEVNPALEAGNEDDEPAQSEDDDSSTEERDELDDELDNDIKDDLTEEATEEEYLDTDNEPARVDDADEINLEDYLG